MEAFGTWNPVEIKLHAQLQTKDDLRLQDCRHLYGGIVLCVLHSQIQCWHFLFQSYGDLQGRVRDGQTTNGHSFCNFWTCPSIDQQATDTVSE